MNVTQTIKLKNFYVGQKEGKRRKNRKGRWTSLTMYMLRDQQSKYN